MSRFLFIRHGETDWNAQGLMQGSNDIPLNRNGIEQALSATAMLRKFPIKKIVSSPQLRAKRTAEIISEGFGAVIHLDEALRERCFGDYEGKKFATLPRTPIDPADPEGPADYPEGKVEPFHLLTMRSKSAIERWLEHHDHDHEGILLFVAHGGVFSALHHALGCGAYLRIQNAKPYEFSCQPDGKWLCAAV